MAKKPLPLAVPGESSTGLPAGEDPVVAAARAADEAAAADALLEPPLPLEAGAAPDYVPDQSEINPASIPHGQSVMSKQGHVISTAEDPRRLAQARALLSGGVTNSRA